MSNEKKGLRFVGTVAAFREWAKERTEKESYSEKERERFMAEASRETPDFSDFEYEDIEAMI